MTFIKRQIKNQEQILYLIVWVTVILISTLGMIFLNRNMGIRLVKFNDILMMWSSFIPFIVLFLIHNYLFIPILDKKRFWLYSVLVVVLVAVFGFYIVKFEEPGRWRKDNHMAPPPREMVDGSRPEPREGPPPAKAGKFPGGRQPTPPNTLKFLIGLFIIGLNLAARGYFKSRENTLKLKELEKENLNQQLQYLRYQINPHFFMNTLNNIHALVDIDPDQAKESIVELSKMMRYILYEGDRPNIPLEKETAFLSNYVSLMKIRYADSVQIDMSLPEDTSGIEVPPMIFVSFVENAFKHGISYDANSYIKVDMHTEGDNLVFKCDNSRHLTNSDKSSGIGIQNVKKRLDLLYGEDYTLDINATDTDYKMLVIIPIKHKESTQN